jgi:ABC-type transport system involved in multi-copper enzyme maturation permease subunit
MNVLLIARLTLLEALRRRLLWALVVLTIGVVVLTGWGFLILVGDARSQGVRELDLVVGVSQVLILVAFMFSFVLAMTAAFLGAPAIAADLDSGVLLVLAARPIRRSDIVLGKWLGLTAIALGYAVASGLLEISMVGVVTGYSPPDPLAASLYLGAHAIVVLTVALLLSTRLPSIAGGAVAVVLFGLSWMSGVLASIASVLGLDSVASTAQAARFLIPLDGLWRGAVFALEPQAILLATGAGGAGRAARLAANNPFSATSGPDAGFLVYVGAWLVLVLALAIVSFRRREI